MWRRHHYQWRAANSGLCSALRAYEHGGIFIVPHLLWQGASVCPVLSEWPLHSLASYDTQGNVENLFLLGSSRVPIQSPLTTHNGMWRTYSNPTWNPVTEKKNNCIMFRFQKFSVELLLFKAVEYLKFACKSAKALLITNYKTAWRECQGKLQNLCKKQYIETLYIEMLFTICQLIL
jgi:hypothetical protein